VVVVVVTELVQLFPVLLVKTFSASETLAALGSMMPETRLARAAAVLAVSVETLALTRVVPEATVRPHLSRGLL
jgi:hypothetical protein